MRINLIQNMTTDNILMYMIIYFTSVHIQGQETPFASVAFSINSLTKLKDKNKYKVTEK